VVVQGEMDNGTSHSTIPDMDEVEFSFNGRKLKGKNGEMISSALIQGGLRVHVHGIVQVECKLGLFRVHRPAGHQK